MHLREVQVPSLNLYSRCSAFPSFHTLTNGQESYLLHGSSTTGVVICSGEERESLFLYLPLPHEDLEFVTVCWRGLGR